MNLFRCFTDWFTSGANLESHAEEVQATIQRLMQLADGLLPKMEDVKAEEIGDLLENEMQGMTSAIEAASQKIQVRCYTNNIENCACL